MCLAYRFGIDDLAALLQGLGELHFCHALQRRLYLAALGFLAPMNCAILHQQGILDGRVQDQKAIILLGEDVIACLGGLLCAFHIFLLRRLKRNNGICCVEDVQKLRQYPLDRVLNVAGDNGRPAIFLIAVWHAEVFFLCAFTLAAERPPHKSRRIFLQGLQVIQQG